MIYGLWASATGAMESSYRMDVISNNLANADTNGFKRQLVNARQRLTAADEVPSLRSRTDPLHEGLGGGSLLSPTLTDFSAGPENANEDALSISIHGDGYFAVENARGKFLTRNGDFSLDREGYMVLGDGSRALSRDLTPIRLNPAELGTTNVALDGAIEQSGRVVGRLAIRQRGASMIKGPGQLFDAGELADVPAFQNPEVESGRIEGSNVEPTREMVDQLQAARFLEANANMIRTQDQTLSRLVTEVGKI